jgi:hypothetical protein
MDDTLTSIRQRRCDDRLRTQAVRDLRRSPPTVVTGRVPPYRRLDVLEPAERDGKDGEDVVGFLPAERPGSRGEHDDAAAHLFDALGGGEVDVHPRGEHIRTYVRLTSRPALASAEAVSRVVLRHFG